MRQDQDRVAVIDPSKAAFEIRARVQDAVKQTIEREVLRPVLLADFSKVEHVRNPAIDLDQEERADGQLRCIGDASDEETFRMFAERLTELSHPLP